MSSSELATRQGQRRNVWALGILGAGGVGVCILLYVFNPAETKLFPPCVLYHYTGLHCPGCGTTRGLHHLLHGNLLGALRYNFLMVVTIPLLIWVGVCQLFSAIGRPTKASLRPLWIWLFFVLILLFGILRNIPMHPFSLLAPPG